MCSAVVAWSSFASNGFEPLVMEETGGGAKAITWPAGACDDDEHDVLTAEKVLLRTNATVTRARRHEMCSGLRDDRLACLPSVARFMACLEEASELRPSHCRRCHCFLM